MTYLVVIGAFFAAVIVMGSGAWYLDVKEREERLIQETLESSRLLEESLNQRLENLDEYRHDLAALLQELDLEQVIAAEERECEETNEAKTQ